MPEDGKGLLYYKRVQHFNIPGHVHFLTFSCYHRLPLLANDLWRTWLAEIIRHNCDRHALALWAYVFMPEHVHLLVKPKNQPYDVAVWLKGIKGAAAKRVVNDLRRVGSPLLDKLRVTPRAGHGLYRFWQAGPGFDKNIWDMALAVEKAQYCHRNPVKRNLVRDPVQWPWSSFRWLEMGVREGEPLKVDDWLE